jgi:serine/threonine protein kinase
MGEVYLARHPRLPGLDALKILPASLTDDVDYRQRFNREADLAATLWHPNIVGLLDRSESFKEVVQQAQTSSEGTVKSAALESISGSTAHVLVASTSKVTNRAGASQDPRSYRLILQVEKIGDGYKVAKVEFVP